jgi:tRNA pseudouridine55 synthase
MPPATSDLHGILVVDKPIGMSSMAVVARIRRQAGGARTGHAGTLDPLADGVLLLALGQATKHIERLMATDKRYHTSIDLSAFTASGDRESEREEVTVAPARRPSSVAIDASLRPFVGTIMQRPPAFSAMKVDGRRAYELARRGKPPEMQLRPVIVHALQVVRYDWPMLELAIHCGKGFYVRALARDIGLALGTGGHCVTLRRTAVGPFGASLAVRLDDVPQPLTQEHLISIEDAGRRLGEMEA